jgi:CHAT domain-containing protein
MLLPNFRTSKLKRFIWRCFVIFCLWIAIDPATWICHRQDIATATTVNNRSTNLSAKSRSQPLNGQKLQQMLDRQDLVNAVSQVERGWQYQYEAYYQNPLKSHYLQLSDIQKKLGQIERSTRTKSALLYAVPRPNGLYLILVSARSTVYKQVREANAKNLSAIANSLRLNIVNPHTTSSEYLVPAQQLDRWLIQPIATELKAQNIDTILFCLGTGLRGLPLAALHDGRQFLVERYNLAIIPAFNLLEFRSTALWGLRVLAMGADKFTDNDNLPAVPVELATITQTGSWPGRVLLNEAFTLQQFQQARSKTPYGIVHLATHADISAKSVKDSYIQFWDRRLGLNEVRELRLKAPAVELLVLSACRTALGTPNAELGFAGLAVQSGAKSVIASLWSLDDMGTLVLMSEFYQQLKTAPFKSNALRSAQIAMLNGDLKFGDRSIDRQVRGSSPLELQSSPERDLSHPYYWAAFTTIGNPW